MFRRRQPPPPLLHGEYLAEISAAPLVLLVASWQLPWPVFFSSFYQLCWDMWFWIMLLLSHVFFTWSSLTSSVFVLILHHKHQAFSRECFDFHCSIIQTHLGVLTQFLSLFLFIWCLLLQLKVLWNIKYLTGNITLNLQVAYFPQNS